MSKLNKTYRIGGWNKELFLTWFFIILNILCLATWIGMIAYLTTVGQSPVFIAFGIISIFVNFISFIIMEWFRW